MPLSSTRKNTGAAGCPCCRGSCNYCGGAEWYTDLQVRYSLLENIEVYVGVDNLFDNAPPLAHVPETRSFGTDAVVFEPIGRSLYAGLTMHF